MSERRTALVTGASRGIGLEVCRQLARRGYRTLLTSRKHADADRTARGLGGEVVGIELDVTDERSISRAAHDAGPVDVLVNNAAILVDEDSDVLAIDLDAYRATLETNLLGAIAMSKAFVHGMIERRYGRVVNVSSGVAALDGMTTYAPAYSISKVALNAFTIVLAAATRGRGVLVSAASPGWVRTRMGGADAPRSVEQGADTIVWLATLPANGPTGGFFGDRKRMDW